MKPLKPTHFQTRQSQGENVVTSERDSWKTAERYSRKERVVYGDNTRLMRETVGAAHFAEETMAEVCSESDSHPGIVCREYVTTVWVLCRWLAGWHASQGLHASSLNCPSGCPEFAQAALRCAVVSQTLLKIAYSHLVILCFPIPVIWMNHTC